MNDRIMLGDIIYKQRRAKNLSQSELGVLVGVTNKAVSKWETYEANPDIQILPRLAEVLGVTTDELLSCTKKDISPTVDSGAVGNDYSADNKPSNLLGISGVTNKGKGYYEFTSDKKTRKGTPYLHVNVGKNADGKIRKANGIVAIGLISKGIVSVGVISLGVISCGVISLGLLAFGTIALGLKIAVGAIAVGIGVSVGGIAIGTIAVGGIAVGVFSVGGISIGVWAHTGEFGKAIGFYTYHHILLNVIR